MNKVAFVTGVSRGLGESLAAGLLDGGWTVFGIGRSAPARLSREGFELLQCDLADAAAVGAIAQQAMLEAAARKPARALLINNAAVAGPVGRMGALQADELASSLLVNLVAPAVLCNAFCNAFGAAGTDRRIVNISSGLAGRVIAGASLYSVGKCGMEMLTRALVADHAEAGFAAITLRPGIIDTQMQVFMRSRAEGDLPDVGMFRDFHDGGQLVAADRVASVTIANLVERAIEPGRTYNYADLAGAS